MAPTPPDLTSLFRAAFREHQAGRLSEAAALYRRALELSPDDARAMMLLGMVLADGTDLAEAERLFRRCLALGSDELVSVAALDRAEARLPGAAVDPLGHSRVEFAVTLFELAKLHQRRGDEDSAILLFSRALAHRPDHALACNDLGTSLHRLGRRDEALAAFDRALAADPKFVTAWRNRGFLLLEQRKPAEAAAAFAEATRLAPEVEEHWFNLGTARLALPDLAGAEEAFRRAVALDPNHVEAHIQLATALEQAHRAEEAAGHRVEAARRHGVREEACTGPRTLARILVLGGAGLCNASLQFLIDRSRFASTIAYVMQPGQADEAQASLADKAADCDLVFNAISDADQGGPFLALAGDFCARLGRPIINPPDERVVRTSRDRVARLLAGIRGLDVPPTRRATRAELESLAAAGATFSPPALIRPVGAHGGEDLERIENAAQLAAYLRAIPCAEFYASEFRDYRGADGYFRKYRLIFVDREVYPYHLAIGRDWKVHYYRVDMAEAPWMKQEEEAFLADWHSAFPGELGRAVRAVAKRLDLDFAGMDCGIAPDGRVLLFEANPSMLVHLHDSKIDYPYKHRYVPRIFEAISRMILRRVAAARASDTEIQPRIDAA